MTLRLIGAGLPHAPVYHMSEAFAHPEHAPTWVAAIEGDPPVWDDFLADYAAGVDAPFSNCWRDLAAAYPDAPVLLSHRGSAEVWHRSMVATVLPRTREMLMRHDDDPMVPLFRVIFADLFTDADDPDDVMVGYERWLVQVRAEIAPERLIEWQPVTAGSRSVAHSAYPSRTCPSPTRTAQQTSWRAPRSVPVRGDDRRDARFCRDPRGASFRVASRACRRKSCECRWGHLTSSPWPLTSRSSRSPRWSSCGPG